MWANSKSEKKDFRKVKFLRAKIARIEKSGHFHLKGWVVIKSLENHTLRSGQVWIF